MNSRLSFALALCLGVLLFSQAEADHHKNKNKDGSDELMQCTIVSSKSDMLCVSPTKLVCQKMKSGKKCCECVGDKTPAPNLVAEFCCTAMYGTKATSSMCDKDRAEAERQAGLVRVGGQPPSSISCVVEKHFPAAQ